MSLLRNPTLIFGSLVGTTAFVGAFLLGHPECLLDDAYILQYAAQGILEGKESRILAAQAMDGATSPFHLLFITALSLALPVSWSPWVAGTLALFAYLLGI
jgi:hypothetical protein